MRAAVVPAQLRRRTTMCELAPGERAERRQRGREHQRDRDRVHGALGGARPLGECRTSDAGRAAPFVEAAHAPARAAIGECASSSCSRVACRRSATTPERFQREARRVLWHAPGAPRLQRQRIHAFQCHALGSACPAQQRAPPAEFVAGEQRHAERMSGAAKRAAVRDVGRLKHSSPPENLMRSTLFPSPGSRASRASTRSATGGGG